MMECVSERKPCLISVVVSAPHREIRLTSLEQQINSCKSGGVGARELV